MNAVKGSYRNGQIILAEPANWPEGTEVLVEPLSQAAGGIPEEDWPNDPQSIAQWIADFEAIPPIEMTAEEEAAWKAAREARKNHELSHWEESSRKIETYRELAGRDLN